MARRGPGVTRRTAPERLDRIVAIVPWIAERDGPTIDEICERFSIDRSELLEDLDVVFMVGIPPYTPDELVDVFIDEDRVWVTLGDYFRRPLRLKTTEALSLVAAAETFGAVTGADPEGPLARALAKIAAVLQIDDLNVVSVNVGDADAAVAAAIQESLATGNALELTYHAAYSDEVTERLVDPQRVFAKDGHLYLSAWCHRSGGDRVFRLDRILSASSSDTPRDSPVSDSQSSGAFFVGRPYRSVALRLDPSARWVVTAYPTAKVTALADGRIDATLPIAGDAWLARLLLRLGSSVDVMGYFDADGNEMDADLPAAARRRLAGAMLTRYR